MASEGDTIYVTSYGYFFSFHVISCNRAPESHVLSDGVGVLCPTSYPCASTANVPVPRRREGAT